MAERCAEVIAQRTRRLTGRTGCGICGADGVDAVLKTIHPIHARGPIEVAAVQRAFEALADRQPLNAASGAVHAAGWARSDGTLELVREDVGRHNALDKLVGAAINAKLDPAAGFVLVTSRASFEMVQKTAVLGAPLLAAISGPTGLAVRVARESGLTLVGFARGATDRVHVPGAAGGSGAGDRRSSGRLGLVRNFQRPSSRAKRGIYFAELSHSAQTSLRSGWRRRP